MTQTPPRARAFLSGDRKRVTLKLKAWSETFPVESLPGRIALYRGLAARLNGRFAATYQPTADALARVAASIAEKPPP
ncbi:hypothetical protein [Maritimibacter sp. DP1N21-5]|uniref:hypothetical protein n=1 Tax=Maritimibacter sp. DP1N21-5 TaxID=2836867 RepID=UPI001C45CE2D|nr:hypothetical protein [Maritimibacter sp. DP1N21-5]MBV7408741.1 hypothetical protein [Maritimibacter sp. DP1N21-5]